MNIEVNAIISIETEYTLKKKIRDDYFEDSLLEIEEQIEEDLKKSFKYNNSNTDKLHSYYSNVSIIGAEISDFISDVDIEYFEGFNIVLHVSTPFKVSSLKHKINSILTPIYYPYHIDVDIDLDSITITD